VADNVDDGVRTRCAYVLGRLGDRSALSALQGALDAWSPPVRRAAIEALGQMPHRSNVEPLLKLLERDDEEPDNRVAVVRALGAQSDTQALGKLRALVHDDKGELAAPAFDALWRSRHLMSKETLVSDVLFALKSTDEGLVDAATSVSADLRAPALVGALVPLMQHRSKHIRNRAAFALGKIGDKGATTALIAQIPKVRESRLLNNIAFALERLDPKSFYRTAGSLIGHKQAAIRMNAAFVVGDVRRPEGLDLLSAAAKDTNDFVRTSAAAALGKIQTKTAVPILESLAADANDSVREEALYSLLAVDAARGKPLVYDKLFEAKDRPRRAMLALAQAGDMRVLPHALTCLESAGCNVDDVRPVVFAAPKGSVGSRVLLAWTHRGDALHEAVSFFQPKEAGPMALATLEASSSAGRWPLAIDAMQVAADAHFKDALPTLEILAHQDNATIRARALVTLLRLGRTDLAPALFAEFDQLPRKRLGAIARAMGSIRADEPRGSLRAELDLREKSAEPEVRMAAYAVDLAWDPETTFFRFLDALASKDGTSRELATRYLAEDDRPIVTSLLRRALAREPRADVASVLLRLVEAKNRFKSPV
jgi:HEAT repeat protein